MREIVIVISVFEKGSKKDSGGSIKRILGFSNDTLENREEVVKVMAHDSLELAINEYKEVNLNAKKNATKKS